MFAPINTRRRLVVCVLGGCVALLLMFWAGSIQGQTGTPAPAPAPAPTTGAVAPQPQPQPALERSRNAALEQDLEGQLNQTRDEMDVMKARIEAMKALIRIGESRLEEAQHARTRYEQLLQAGKVTEDRYLAARDDVLMLEAHLASEKAELKVAEMRLKHAQRRLEYGEYPMSNLERRLLEIEQRLASTEMKLDLVQHEVGRLRREHPREGTGAK